MFWKRSVSQFDISQEATPKYSKIPSAHYPSTLHTWRKLGYSNSSTASLKEEYCGTLPVESETNFKAGEATPYHLPRPWFANAGTMPCDCKPILWNLYLSPRSTKQMPINLTFPLLGCMLCEGGHKPHARKTVKTNHEKRNDSKPMNSASTSLVLVEGFDPKAIKY